MYRVKALSFPPPPVAPVNRLALGLAADGQTSASSTRMATARGHFLGGAQTLGKEKAVPK